MRRKTNFPTSSATVFEFVHYSVSNHYQLAGAFSSFLQPAIGRMINVVFNRPFSSFPKLSTLKVRRYIS
jgi:hypothetical protein